MPGSHERAMEKARTLPVDAIILDLEDAVALKDKETARQRVCQAVSDRGFGERLVIVRINDVHTTTGEDDLQAALAVGPDVVLIPKVRTVQDLVWVSSRIDEFADQKIVSDVQIWVMMETPMAILNARDIADCAKTMVPRLTGFVMGTNDLIRETGVAPTHISLWLMDCVLVAKAYGLSIIDGVYNQFFDTTGLQEECKRGRGMGMDGKTLIHPSQIDSCNEIFSPTDDEVLEARDLVAFFERPENKGASVLDMGGRMVEQLHYEMALKTLQMARLIETNGVG